MFNITHCSVFAGILCETNHLREMFESIYLMYEHTMWIDRVENRKTQESLILGKGKRLYGLICTQIIFACKDCDKTEGDNA